MKKMHVMPLSCIFLLTFGIPPHKQDDILILGGFCHGD